MNELPPEVASLLDAERSAQRAPEADLDRTLSRLHATLLFADVAGAGAIAEAAQAASTPSVAPALSVSKGALFAGKSLKVLLAGVTLGGAIGGTVLGVRMQQAERAPPRSQSVVVSAPMHPAERADEHEPAPGAESARAGEQAVVSSARPTEAAREEPRARVEGPVVEAASAPLALQGRQVARAATSSSQRARRTGGASDARSAAATTSATEDVVPALEAAPPQVAEAKDEEAPSAPPAPEKPPQVAQPSELDLIDRAFAQLRAHQGESALALLERHAALYPRGKFAMEGAGLRVLALCDAGRVDEARGARRAFLARANNSPIAARVRAACAPERP